MTNNCNVEYDDVINNIKDIIEEKGLKQSFVAKKAGLTPQELSNILNDRRKLLRVEYLPGVADALGMTVDDLYRKRKEVG